jgi:hypothetical protein
LRWRAFRLGRGATTSRRPAARPGAS